MSLFGPAKKILSVVIGRGSMRPASAVAWAERDETEGAVCTRRQLPFGALSKIASLLRPIKAKDKPVP